MKLVVVAVAFAVVGCDDDPKKDLVDAPVAVDMSGGDAPLLDAAPDAPPDAFGGYQGLVSISETLTGPSAGSSADAVFTNGSIFGTVLATSGECTLYDTISTPNEGWSAGTIQMTGAAAPITLEPMGTAPTVTYEPTVEVLEDAFTPGAVVTMTASGSADIPAFSGTVTAPDKLAGWTAPAEISRAAGWSTTWTASSNSTEIWTYVIALNMSAGRLLLCRTADDGAYTVPPAALALIPQSFTQALSAVIRVSRTDVTAGTSMIGLYLVDGSISGSITLAP